MKFIKIALIFIGSIIAFMLIIGIVSYCYVINLDDVNPPIVKHSKFTNVIPEQISENIKVIDKDYLLKNEYGIYELKVSGNPYDRGVKEGILTKDLLAYQEGAYINNILSKLPSKGYSQYIKYCISFINRDLSKTIPKEYREEIYGISQNASDSFKWIGSGYSRLLNYHAAHDLGHTFQHAINVGCTSFGVWGNKSENGAMIIGRNFDYYVGDQFAENKIISFIKPDSGYAFASISWAGFIGVVSGMNNQGITVTLNSNSTEMPSNVATPVSIVAREILQYAKNIDEAVIIAKKSNIFVNESFLVASAKEKKVIIIEKTPTELGIYETYSHDIKCTNHFQSKEFNHDELNRQEIQSGSSSYRQKRLEQLLNNNYPLNVEKAVNILRDYKGINNSNIGLGNEKCINQFIAHHSVVFMPDSLQFWVSTSPWQMGAYICYDLNKIFSCKSDIRTMTHTSLPAKLIPVDNNLYSTEFKAYLNYVAFKKAITRNNQFVLEESELIKSNPEYFETYKLIGDYYLHHQNKKGALSMYQLALKKEIPTELVKSNIQSKINAVNMKK